METLSPGPNPRIGEPCAGVSPATPALVSVTAPRLVLQQGYGRTAAPVRGRGQGRGFVPASRPGSNGSERSRNMIEAQGVENLTRDSGSVTDGSSAVTNLGWRAGDCLRKRAARLRQQTRIRDVDYDERTRNIIDIEGRSDLCRNKAAKGGRIGIRSRHPVQVTVTSGKVPVTPAAGSKIVWQAGMSKRMSHVRSCVPVTSRGAARMPATSNDHAGKGENHPRQAGMYKGMNSLAGYVACRDRDN